MLLDVAFVFRQPGFVAMIALGVLVLKTVITGLVVILLGFPSRTAMLTGLALSQVGEFSFILSRTGVEYDLLNGNVYQLFLSVSVLTMAAAPFVIALAPRVAELVLRLPLPKKLKMGFYPVAPMNHANVRDRLKDHLIIIGFGVNGRNLARAAKVGGIPYIIIEMNPETVRSEKAKGEPICYGDATQEAVLDHADIKEARIVVVAISDPAATRRITAMARRFNPKVHIIARTRYLQEVKPLYELGADEVIPEEFETSVEIFTRVLAKYLIPRVEIEKFVAEVRSSGYEIFRSLSKEPVSFSDLKFHLPDVEISTLRVNEKSPLVGKSLAQIELRKKYGVTLLAIRREAQILPNPQSVTPFYAHDKLFVLGSLDKIAEVMRLMRDVN